MDHDIFPPNVILRYVEQYIDESYTIKGDWVNFGSVFTSDHGEHCGINLKTNGVNDFKLRGWSLAEFVAEQQGLPSEMDGRAFLMKIALDLGSWDREFDDHVRILDPTTPPELTPLPDMRPFGPNMGPVGVETARYLYSRGITDNHIRRYGLCYSETRKCPVCSGTGYITDDQKCGLCDASTVNPFFGRIIIPTYENGKLVYLQGRSIRADQEPRYLNPKAPRLQVLYFHDLLEPGEDVYVTEGPFDAMTLFNYNATCLLNLNFEDPKILKLAARQPKRIIFVPQWDSTEEGRMRAQKALDHNVERTLRLSAGIPVGVYHWYQRFPKNARPKDINEAQVTSVDENLIEWRQGRAADPVIWGEDEYQPQSATATRGR